MRISLDHEPSCICCRLNYGMVWNHSVATKTACVRTAHTLHLNLRFASPAGRVWGVATHAVCGNAGYGLLLRPSISWCSCVCIVVMDWTTNAGDGTALAFSMRLSSRSLSIQCQRALPRTLIPFGLWLEDGMAVLSTLQCRALWSGAECRHTGGGKSRVYPGGEDTRSGIYAPQITFVWKKSRHTFFSSMN